MGDKDEAPSSSRRAWDFFAGSSAAATSCQNAGGKVRKISVRLDRRRRHLRGYLRLQRPSCLVEVACLAMWNQ